ncbi:hypothetical protein GCM10025857_02710 [Alicyclobacillus contaminans]|nr:hypothetical protein GCM10025857_02710 [Alicyclobacillus contaminans]
MKELGRVLRNRREQLNITLDELQEKTKIRKRYLIALEDGDWDLLPGDVYARGLCAAMRRRWVSTENNCWNNT